MVSTMTAPTITQLSEEGPKIFASCLGRWMEHNHWHFRTIPAIAHAVLGAKWVVESQVNYLSRCRLERPNPKVFYALWAVNNALYLWHTTGERPTGIRADLYEKAEVWVDDEGLPISLEKLMLLFLGLWVPKNYSPVVVVTDEQALAAGKKLAVLVQNQMLSKGQIPILGMDSFMAVYPVADEERRSRLRAILTPIEGAIYTAETLTEDLPDVAAALTAYTGEVWTEPNLRELLGLPIT